MIPVCGLYELPVLANKHKVKFPGGHLGNLVLELNKEGKGEEGEEEEESGRQETGRKEGKKSNSKEFFFPDCLLFLASDVSCVNKLYMKILQPSCNHVGKVEGTAETYSQL